MLNDPAMINAAVAFAAALLNFEQQETSEAKIKRAFQLTVSRQPDSFELTSLSKLLDSEIQHYRSQPQDAHKLLDTIDKNIAIESVNPQQLAAWTTLTRALLNLQETVTRY